MLSSPFINKQKLQKRTDHPPNPILEEAKEDLQRWISFMDRIMGWAKRFQEDLQNAPDLSLEQIDLLDSIVEQMWMDIALLEDNTPIHMTFFNLMKGMNR